MQLSPNKPSRPPKSDTSIGNRKAWGYSLALHGALLLAMGIGAWLSSSKDETPQTFELMTPGNGTGIGSGGSGHGGQPSAASELTTSPSTVQPVQLEGKHPLSQLPTDVIQHPSENIIQTTPKQPQSLPETIKPLTHPVQTKHFPSKKTLKPHTKPKKLPQKTPKQTKTIQPQPKAISYEEFIKQHGKSPRLIKKKSMARGKAAFQIPNIQVPPNLNQNWGTTQGPSAHSRQGNASPNTHASLNGGLPGTGTSSGSRQATGGGKGLGIGNGIGSGIGDGIGPGNHLGGGGVDAIFQAYLIQIRSLVESAWEKPHLHMRKKLTGTVEFTIDASGYCQHATIFEGSGNALFDASILDAFKKLKHFPIPPHRKTYTFHLTFEETL